MTLDEREDFEMYVACLSDQQVEDVIEKEKEFAGVDKERAECLHIARNEMKRRG